MPQNFDGTLQLDRNQFAYATSAGPIQCQGWPRYAYHETEPTRTVSTEEEFKALGEGWSLTYIHKDYPKMKFKEGYEPVVVNSPEDEGKYEGYTDTPPERPDSAEPKQLPGQHTLQSQAEAIRDSRRLSLDYVQLNQDLDCKADNVAMREISEKDVPHPQYKPVETEEQIRKRREEDEAKRRRQQEAAAKQKENGEKGKN